MYAVMPGIPRTPTAVETGAFAESTLRVLPPARAIEWVCQPGERVDDVARRESLRPRFDDLAHPAGRHHPAQLHPRGVARPRLVHAASHVGVEREVKGAEEHFAVARGRDRPVLEAEVGLFRSPVGAGGEDDASVPGHAFAPVACLMVGPISRWSTRSAMSSKSVGSRLRMTRRAPRRLARAGNPAAG